MPLFFRILYAINHLHHKFHHGDHKQYLTYKQRNETHTHHKTSYKKLKPCDWRLATLPYARSVKYHRRYHVSLPCSEWERVVPWRQVTRRTVLIIYKESNDNKNEWTQKSFLAVPVESISTPRLNALLRFHLEPINLVVFKGSYFLAEARRDI